MLAVPFYVHDKFMQQQKKAELTAFATETGSVDINATRSRFSTGKFYEFHFSL